MSRWSGVLLAIAASAVAALAPVEAAAWGGHGWGGHGWHFGHLGHFGHFQHFGRFGAFGRFPGTAVGGYLGYYDSPDYSLGCVWARQLVPTPDGPHYRYFPVCDGY
jgi:hypothetical protein